MARSHARRKTGRGLIKRSHPGQEHGSARKRFRQMRKKFARLNHAQLRQSEVDCVIVVNGRRSYGDIFEGKTVRIRPEYAKYYGAESVPELEYFRVNSDLNRVSYERSVVSALMTMGYQLEALEVEFDHKEGRKWGRCYWQKDHSSYHEPMTGCFAKLSPAARSLAFSVFRTQFAGEQKFGMLSMQMFGAVLLGQPEVLLHKTIIFRRVVLSPPPATSEQMAKAA